MIASATLNGNKVIELRSTIPAWGASYHDVTIDVQVTLSGSVTLKVADATFRCTVLSGGPALVGSFYRLVAGSAGWGKTLVKRSYANDAGVKLSTVLGDAASEAGEQLDAATVDNTVRLGPAFVRPAGPACRILEIVAPNAWYIGEDGKTRLGQRAKSTLSTTIQATSLVDLARGTVTIASDAIVTLLPGLQVKGLDIVDVEHEMSAKAGLRSKLWGRRSGGNDRRLAAWRAIVDQLDPDRMFRAIYEYRIVSQSGNRLNLQPVRVSTGMPDLLRVPVRPGVPGTNAVYLAGSRVVVGFVDADPSRPSVLSFEDPDGSGFVPTSVSLAGGGPAVGRVGDAIQISVAEWNAASPVAGSSPVTISNPMNGTIHSGSSKVTSG